MAHKVGELKYGLVSYKSGLKEHVIISDACTRTLAKKVPCFQADNFCSRFFRIKLISICHFVVVRTMIITYCTECSTIQKTITNSVWPQVTSIQLYRKIHLLIVNNTFWSSFSGLGTAFFYVLNASFLLHSCTQLSFVFFFRVFGDL